MWRTKRVDKCCAPVRTSEYARDDVSDVEERSAKKNLFYALVCSFHDDEPHDNRTNGNTDVAAHAEQFETTRNSQELRDDVSEVDDHQRKHHQKRCTDSEFLADQVAQTLTSCGSHAGAHLLNHDQ